MQEIKNGITDAFSTADCCPLLSIVVHCCLLLSIVVLCWKKATQFKFSFVEQLDAASTWHPPQIVVTMSLRDWPNVGKHIFVSFNLAATFEPSINITNLKPRDNRLHAAITSFLMITKLWSFSWITWSEFSSQLLCFLCSLQWGRILSVPGEDVMTVWKKGFLRLSSPHFKGITPSKDILCSGGEVNL